MISMMKSSKNYTDKNYTLFPEKNASPNSYSMPSTTLED